MDPFAQAGQQTQSPTPTPEETIAAENQALIKKQQKQQQQQTEAFNMADLSRAMAILNPNSNSPQVNIGKAIKTPAYAGLCLQYVDDKQGNPNRLPTAYADYEARAQAGLINQSEKNIPSGARVYFAPDDSNGGAGHVGIANSNNTFTSATDNGIKTFSIADWEKYTNQRFIGWAPPPSK